jgi:hypothetical protein
VTGQTIQHRRAQHQRREEAAVAISALMFEEDRTDLNNHRFFSNLRPTYGQQRCAGIDQLLGDTRIAKAASNLQGCDVVPGHNVMKRKRYADKKMPLFGHNTKMLFQ